MSTQKSTSLRWLFLVAVLAAPLNPGCLCSGNGHLEPRPFVAKVADNLVNCNCNLTFHNDYCTDTGGTCNSHLTLQLCLPPELNVNTASAAQRTAIESLTDEQFAQRVDDYCKKTVSTIVYHTIKVFNGGWCEYKAPFAPDGGIGQSVECFALPLSGDKTGATARDTTTCDKPCPDVICDDKTNCGKGVQDDQGNVHLDKCNCNQITFDYTCPGDDPHDIPTPIYCKPATDVVVN
jgi:hypothetical protein